MGSAAMQMERRGIRTERGDRNREIDVTNQQIRQLRARINHLQKWIAEEAANTEPPTLADVLDEIFTRQGQSALARLKNGAEVFNFLRCNKIYNMEDLEKKVSAMHGKVNSVRTDLKKVERRVDTLKEHIRHSVNFKDCRKLKARYDELSSLYTIARKTTGFGVERKAQKALDAANEYYEAHRSELAMFNNAEQYLRDVLQGRFDPKKLPPITKWRGELAAKSTEKETLYTKYYALKDETAKVEKIQRSVAEIMRAERQPTRAQGIEL